MLNIYFEIPLIVLLGFAIYYLVKYSKKYSEVQEQVNYTKIQMDSNTNEINNLKVIERQYYELQDKFESFAKVKINKYPKKVDIDDIKTFVYAYLNKYYLISDGMDSIKKLIDSYLIFHETDGEFVYLLPSDCMELIINPILKQYHEGNSLLQLPTPPINNTFLGLELNNLEIDTENSNLLDLNL